MPIKWGGFGRSIKRKTTLEDILKLGKSIDESLATGRAIVANLAKDEKRAWEYYKKCL
jgi:hypothetical protein